MLRSLSGVADAEQLAELAKLLDDHAKDRGLSGDEDAWREWAHRIIVMFNHGVTDPEEIRRRLDAGRWN